MFAYRRKGGRKRGREGKGGEKEEGKHNEWHSIHSLQMDLDMVHRPCTSMVSRATSSSVLVTLVSLCLSPTPSDTIGSVPPVPTVSGSSRSSLTPTLEDWEAAEGWRRGRRGAGASSAWLHRRNLYMVG